MPKKRRGRGSSLIPFPNTTWATEASVPVGMPVIDLSDGNKVKQSVQCFNNDGDDAINCGRPSNIVNKLRPQIDEFTIEFIGKFKSFSNCSFVSLGTDSEIGSTRQLLIGLANSAWRADVGGNVISAPYTTDIDEVFKFTLSCSLTTAYMYINDVLIKSSAIGAYVGVDNLYINEILDGGFGSFTGNSYSVSFYQGFNATSTSKVGLSLIDKYDLTNKNQWDGGPTGVSQNGNPFTVTDGIPTTAYSKALLGVNLL